MGLLAGLAIAVGAGGAVVSAPIVLGAVGFTSVGIAAGSYAASMMSAAAIANGGGVAAGSAVAVLQSVALNIKFCFRGNETFLAIKINPFQSRRRADKDMDPVTAVCSAAGAVGAVVAAPALLGAAGFTSAGIAAGSYAAGMMSSAAVANGGGVAAGSVVAVLQSAGAAGLSATAGAAVAGAGAAVGWLASFIS
ncbi:interferon alpha-inducible protein 27-like protein 2B [Simochromis diagramma]|uniref:interferon alpha-inducible protein 27-like protein 2B n=1 Tax=Simochromis diagramma TaxID=43689 RepID=UPI001A7E6ECA|nr:interferon alpha-inducible protein 27-like protein 2B [Simochromis diagramma]